MARRRKGAFKRFARSGFSRAKRYVKRSSNPASGSLFQLDAMAYGAARGPVAQAVLPYVPAFAGEATDEVVMGGLCWLAAKYVPVAFVKNMAKKGLIVENARVGEIARNMVMGVTSKPDTSSSQSW